MTDEERRDKAMAYATCLAPGPWMDCRRLIQCAEEIAAYLETGAIPDATEQDLRDLLPTIAERFTKQ